MNNLDTETKSRDYSASKGKVKKYSATEGKSEGAILRLW